MSMPEIPVADVEVLSGKSVSYRLDFRLSKKDGSLVTELELDQFMELIRHIAKREGFLFGGSIKPSE